jgi:hypothetical protein
VRDPQRVREVLDAYDVRGVEIQLTEEGSGGTLEMAFEAGGLEEEDPTALHQDRWPDEDPYPDEDEEDEDSSDETEEDEEDDDSSDETEEDESDEDSWEEDEWDRRHRDEGDNGFLALLRDLAPHLETPLLVLAMEQGFMGASAQAWIVQPGAKEVETLGVAL